MLPRVMPLISCCSRVSTELSSSKGLNSISRSLSWGRKRKRHPQVPFSDSFPHDLDALFLLRRLRRGGRGAADGGDRFPFPADRLEHRDRAVLDVAFFVESDRAGDAVVIDPGELRKEPGGLGRAGFPHGLDEHV